MRSCATLASTPLTWPAATATSLPRRTCPSSTRRGPRTWSRSRRKSWQPTTSAFTFSTASSAQKTAPCFSVEETEIASGLRARIYRPVAREVLPVLLYFHGGGWVVGSLDSHDGVARFLANHAGSLVISVDYRLGPENRFPAAVEDAWASVTWAHEHAADGGGDASRLAVGGDSSGGNLAAVVARHARDRGIAIALQL